MPVDGNIERVVTRLYAIETPLPKAKAEVQQRALSLMDEARPGDCAQAAMDLGATICTPKRPACALCPLNDGCLARVRGDQDSFPRKAAKRTGELRCGAAFVVLRGDDVLLQTRPTKGLLGGMSEVPGSEWLVGQSAARARAQAPVLLGLSRWRRIPGTVRHVFTHFPLELTVYRASVPQSALPPGGMRWVSRDALPGEALPNLMRKVLAHAFASA
jgi:A/G-specific adenine glycosylase